MKKLLTLLLICIFLLSGCVRGELEALNSSLTEELSDKEKDVSDLNDELDELNTELDLLSEKYSDAESFVQTLNDENMELKKENEELQNTIFEIEEAKLENLIGYWMGNTYKNDYFKISISKPDNYNQLDEDDLAKVIGLSLDVLNEYTDMGIDSITEGTILPLFVIYKGDDFNAADSTAVMTLTKSGIKYDLNNYIESSKPYWEQLFSSAGECTFYEIEDVIIDQILIKNQKLRIDLANSDKILFSSYYFFYIDDYIASIVLTYQEDNEIEVLEILNSLTLK